MQSTRSKKRLLAACRLYLILDTQVCDYARLWEILKVAVRSGVNIVQLRDKIGKSRETLYFARKVQQYLAERIPFIVNDRVDIARLAGASGVHVGQDDIPVAEARRILGVRKIVGLSARTLAHVQGAVKDRADYIGFGAVYETRTKPESSPVELGLLKQAVRMAQVARIPLFAIGGIERSNLPFVLSCGVKRIAVCRGILSAGDIRTSVDELRYELDAV